MNMVSKIWKKIEYLKLHKSKEEEVKISPEIIRKAAELIIKEQNASVMLIKIKLKLNYFKAAKVFEILENKGIVGPFNNGNPRKIFETDFEKRL